ncbi:MAG TPA: gamma-glutamyltransferase [Acetobacteraceae bacterium]|nr:gamma-glutamyltransferase [Acetobacteraceae bacterium]
MSHIGLVAIGVTALALAPGRPAAAAFPPAVESATGMVVTAQAIASDVGAAILRAGGNAVDAAVAVGYAESVVNPCCGNLGGGGFMVIHLAGGRDTFINFREMAPAAASADMYLDAAGKVIPHASLIGWKAVAVPGTVQGLDTALREYGTMPRTQVMAPAIRLARDGFTLTRGDTEILDSKAAAFRARPELAQIFLRPDGTPLQPGDVLVQAALAATLEAIVRDGPDAFYRGRIPADIEAASRAAGGIITAADLAAYHATESPPLSCTYRGYVVLSTPPPSSGGTTMCEILNILEGYDMSALGFHSAQAGHVMTEAMRHAYLDRNTQLGDPAFVHNPLGRLLSKQYAAAIRAAILPDRATPSAALGPATAPHEGGETTHYSIADRAGNAVSVTYTINALFGALVMADGFLLNDEMDDFTAKPGVPNLFGLVQGTANAIAPGKRPLSSMAPSLVMRDGHVAMVVGSPGGSRIITITLETIMNMIDYGMAPGAAVDAPRIHHQWLPDKLYAEPLALSPDTQRLLAGMGYDVVTQAPWGAAELIAIDRGRFYGANDARRPAGAAVAP